MISFKIFCYDVDSPPMLNEIEEAKTNLKGRSRNESYLQSPKAESMKYDVSKKNIHTQTNKKDKFEITKNAMAQQKLAYMNLLRSNQASACALGEMKKAKKQRKVQGSRLKKEKLD